MPSPLFPPGSRPRGFWYHVTHSTYVTAVTDWFLSFVGKAAHLTLILTTLYTSAELLPDVTLPQSVNNAVFVVQMLALDVGGMGLAKLAMQARDQGNDAGASQAEHLSRWLIRIVIASLVTVALEQAVRAIPGLTSISAMVEGVTIVIGGALTIARAICAVHYGRVMHLLHPDDVGESPPQPAVEELVRQVVDEASAAIRAEWHQALTQVRQDIERRLPIIHDVASASSQRPEPLGQRQDQRSEPVASAPKPEPQFRASAASDERLQAAYALLVAQGQRISGRALAREAHVNRAAASTWLATVEDHRLESAPESETEAESDIPPDQ